MTGLLVRLAVMVAIFASVFLLSQLVLTQVWSRRAERSAVNARMRMLRKGMDRDAAAVSLLKNAPPRLQPDASLLERLHVRFMRMLMMSAIRFDANQVLLNMALACGGLIAAMLVLVMVAGFTVSFGVVQLVVAVSAAITVGLPLMVLSRLAEKRRKRMEEQFPVALDIFARSLRAGHPIASAIGIITEEMHDPIGSEFGLVSDEVSYGAELNEALLAMAERWDLEDIRMFVVCVSVQSETGGNLAEIVENLSKVIRDRATLYLKVRALSSEGRMTGWMLTVLPVLSLVSMFLVNPGFYIDVADDPIFVYGFPGLILLYILGVYSIRRLTNLKV